ITLYGDLPYGDPSRFGDPVWKNGDGQCFVWRTDTVPQEPWPLPYEGCSEARKLGTGPLPAGGGSSALAAFGGAASEDDFLAVAPTPSIPADLAPGGRTFVLYREITTKMVVPIAVDVVGFMPNVFGGVLGTVDRYAVRTIGPALPSLAGGSVVALP